MASLKSVDSGSLSPVGVGDVCPSSDSFCRLLAGSISSFARVSGHYEYEESIDVSDEQSRGLVGRDSKVWLESLLSAADWSALAVALSAAFAVPLLGVSVQLQSTRTRRSNKDFKTSIFHPYPKLFGRGHGQMQWSEWPRFHCVGILTTSSSHFLRFQVLFPPSIVIQVDSQNC